VTKSENYLQTPVAMATCFAACCLLHGLGTSMESG
jgi:hypothetical protein